MELQASGSMTPCKSAWHSFFFLFFLYFLLFIFFTQECIRALKINKKKHFYNDFLGFGVYFLRYTFLLLEECSFHAFSTLDSYLKL